MQKITPFLWFNNQAEEAMNFYVSIFKNSRIGRVSRYSDSGPGPKGSFMVGTFYVDGQEFMVINGGLTYKLTRAFSMLVNCERQEEIDFYWDRLTADGGKPIRCGWLDDKFGLAWQIVPTALGKMMSSGDGEKSNRVMQALLKMDKLVIADLQKAYDG